MKEKNNYKDMTDDEQIRNHIHELKQKAECLDINATYETITSHLQLMDQLYKIDDHIYAIIKHMDNKLNKAQRKRYRKKYMNNDDYTAYEQRFEGMIKEEQIRIHIHELKQKAECLNMDTTYETIESNFQLRDQLYQIEDQILFISHCVDEKTDKKRRNSKLEWIILGILAIIVITLKIAFPN